MIEYMTATYFYSIDDAVVMESMLNKLGLDRWEFCGFAPHSDSIWIFKREVEVADVTTFRVERK